MELSRRFFLGGAIALIAAQTFKPSVNAMGNMPTIYGDGVNDDSFGLASLFRNDPVIFSKDQIGVEDHKGIIFKKGNFVILNSVDVPKELKLEVEYANFTDATLELYNNDAYAFRVKEMLPINDPFFRFYDKNYPCMNEIFQTKCCFVTHQKSSRMLTQNVGF